MQTPVQLQDLYDTLLDLADLHDTTPHSLLPVIDGKARPGPILAKAYASRAWKEGFGGRFAHDWTLYREDNWALVSNSGGKRELFDLSGDPGMLRDVAKEQVERVKAMSVRSDAAFPESASGDTDLEMSPDMIEELKALGYLED